MPTAKPSEVILSAVDKNRHLVPHWRYGQHIFNAAYELFPEFADELRGGPVDPFHRDLLVWSFLAEIDKLVAQAEGQ